MSSECRYNSKRQLIEELDIHLEKVLPNSYSSNKSLKRTRSEINSDLEPSEKKIKQNTSHAPFPNLEQNIKKTEKPLAKSFTKMEEEEILAWCEAYLYLKNRGINIYKI